MWSLIRKLLRMDLGISEKKKESNYRGNEIANIQ